MATEPARTHSHSAKAAGAAVRRHGSRRPRRARARTGGQHPLRVGRADPLERGYPTVRTGLRGRTGDPGALSAEHLGRGGPPRDPPRPPVRDHVEPDELRRSPQGHRHRGRPRRVGTDAMSPLFAQLLPMAFPDAEIVDGGPALAARRIKTAEEIDAIRSAIGVAEAAMAAAVSELRPGVTERELTGVFMDAMASRASRRRRPRTSSASPRPRARPRAGDRRSRRETSCRSTPASSPTAMPARWVGPGPSSPSRLGRRRRACTSARTSCGSGSSARAGRAPRQRPPRRVPRSR